MLAVDLKYSIERGKQIKESKGVTVTNVARSRQNEDNKINW